MEKLQRDIRDACPSGLWSRGVRLSREDKVVLESRSDAEIVFRILSPGRRVEPTVVLYPGDRDWECDCGSKFDACEHVAAAVLTVMRAGESGTELRAVDTNRAGTLRYRFERRRGQLHLARDVTDEDGKTITLRRSVTAHTTGLADGRAIKILPEHADLEADAALGPHPTELLGARVTGKLCRALAGHPRATLDGEPVVISSEPVAPVVLVTSAGRDLLLRVARAAELDEVIAPGLGLVGGVIHPLAATSITGASLEHLPLSRRFREAEIGELVGELLPKLALELHVSIGPDVVLPTMVAGQEPRIDLGLRQADGSVEVLPRLIYGLPAAPLARIDGEKLVHLRGDIPRRDLTAERRLVASLRSELNLVCNRSVGFRGAEAAAFLRRHRESSFAENAADIAAARDLFAQIALVDGRVEIRFTTIGGDGAPESASPADVMAAYEAQNQIAPLAGGGFGRIPLEWIDERASLIRDLLAGAGGGGGLRAANAAASLAIEQDVALPADLERLRPLLGAFDALPAPTIPDGFVGELRDYQRTGVAWLSFLRDAGLGALLADDMGLGKTVQVLATLDGPTLVVAPTSTLPNWRREIARFRPDLEVCLYHGPSRELTDADVTLTSYALLRRDIERLEAREWRTVVLDEAQAIKNPDAQASRASRRLRSEARVAMSGTPVENRLDELWSISEFLNPGLLRARSEFAAEMAKPIASGDARALARLRRLLRPVVLRRRKSEVAAELPPRIEVVDACELSASEREIYDAVRAAARADVVAKLGASASPIAALTALLRLRQAACHPALLPGRVAESSSKLDRLGELLGEAVAGDHKALVFSQWTSLLDLVETRLRALDIGFTRLDGSTRDRGGVVDEFQSSDGPPVMLISLKAGGTGLNLTAADHVFLLDPWWNPAVEAQAADRAHRIGQDKPVFVHRMVAADTVEERILELQERKRHLADAAVGGVGAGAALTRDDLLALLD